MKKFLIFLAICLMLAAAALGVMVKDQLSRKVIWLHNGQAIAADRAWEMAGDLYYETDKGVRVVRLADIRSVEPPGFLQALRAAGAKSTGYLDAGWSALQRLGSRPHARPWYFNSMAGMILAAAAATALLFLHFRRSRRPASPALASDPAPNSPKTDLELPGQADVIRFFLNLYRQQVGAGPAAAAEFTQMAAVGTGSKSIYELRVRQGSDWVRRRMTIGSLGDENSSKSKCYYVIFDKHLVVKIPPKPILDFETYVASIRRERRIVDRLAPKECIIPEVSVILSEVHPLPSQTEMPAGLLEEKYLAWLRQNPNHQSCLKIKDTFAYFMDLSRYYFLSHIMDSFRDFDDALRTEFASTIELVRHPGKFRERYGEENEALGFEIHDLYHQCEADIRQLLARSGKTAEATDSRIQTWFVRYLESKQIGQTGAELSPELVSGVSAVFTQRFENYRNSVKACTRLLRSAARRRGLEQNRLPIGGIITHLLELLAWLGAKKVAMRDLKPDNLLVAGDARNYPAFLRSPTDYSLGFIDVETAVCFDDDPENGNRQPLLGGTPYYATPSHLFPNSTLEACFGDATRVLHFQDWQAVLVMIFDAVTGELLFDRTARHFAEIRSRVAGSMHSAASLNAALADASRRFWRSAATEFRDKMKTAEKSLRFVEADLTKPARTLFLQTLQREIEFIQAGIKERIETQAWFETPQSRETLRAASHERILRFMDELKTESRAGRRPTASLLAGAGFLKDLAARKAKVQRTARVVAHLESGAGGRMSAYDLLTLMFGRVLQVMHRNEWDDAPEASAGAAAPPDAELNMATVISRPSEPAGRTECTKVLT